MKEKSRQLRHGYTTGVCAAAAAKAGAILLRGFLADGGAGTGVSDVRICLPGGKLVKIAISETKVLTKGRSPETYAAVLKDAGDDPDVTDGLEIVARVRLIEGEKGVVIKGGTGVGVVTGPGLQVRAGEPAINPVPCRMIRDAVRGVIPEGGVEVEISVPGGEEVAEKTFNPRLGIVGGISIIGTTGIVVPMSVDALKATIRCEIDVAYEEAKPRDSKPGIEDSKPLFLVPGKIGEDAVKALFGDIRIVQMSNFVGHALSYASKRGFRNIALGGHPGKLAKILMGYYDTHSKNSPQAKEFVADFLGVRGDFNTVEEIVRSRENAAGADCNERKKTLSDLAREIARKINDDFGFKSTIVCLFDMKKNLIGKGIWVG
ncbi:cobalt-precorrin-6A synthase [bacterium BMS3Abin08]|nr:cobalt-precorrin-6A synthase [bacterium BMS3Abin08]